MKTIYIYVLDTLADWELGYITAELNSRHFFKEDAPLLKIKTISHSKKINQYYGRNQNYS